MGDMPGRRPPPAAGVRIGWEEVPEPVLLAGCSVYIVDWLWASLGAAWVEALCFAPSVEMQGGPRRPKSSPPRPRAPAPIPAW